MPLTIRLATPSDLPTINAIYNHYVLHSTCTYQTEPETPDARAAWFASHGPAHPVTVAEIDGEVVGWGSLSAFHRRAAYARTVENSLYVRHDRHRRGIGRALLEQAEAWARAAGIRKLELHVFPWNEPAIKLYEQYGFEREGLRRDHYRRGDEFVDAILMAYRV